MSRFNYVPASAWYGDAVEWAVEESVADGNGNDTFSPDDACTRAQIVTFIWRMAGAPEPSERFAEIFRDLAPDAYYYKAVAWASNRYVVSGTTLQKFSPYSTCTRAQIVTMLYRMQRSDTEALRTGDIQSVHIENLAINSELTLTAWEIDEFKAIVSRAALNNNPQPQFGQGQTSNPMYVVHI